MRQGITRIKGLVRLLVVLGLTVLGLSGCFLLGPEVPIPTLSSKSTQVVGVIKTETLEPTKTVGKTVSGEKTITSKPSVTKESASATSSATPTATKEPSTSTPTITPKPPTATPTNQPPCPQQVDDRLLAAYNAVGGRARLGCAKAGAIAEQWGYQKYEHGWMFWRGPKTVIHAGTADGVYSVYPDEWNSSLPERACDYPAPTGLMQPKRGFGLVWCENDSLRSAIGFAMAEEFPAQTVVQEFDKGIIAAQASGSTRVFFSDGTWQDLGFPL